MVPKTHRHRRQSLASPRRRAFMLLSCRQGAPLAAHCDSRLRIRTAPSEGVRKNSAVIRPDSNPLRPFKVERYFAKYEFNAPYLLCCSDCEPLSLASILADADADCKQRWENLSLGYTEAPGNPALREEISTTYDTTGAGNIVVLAPEEGIYLTLKALLKPGDHVVVTHPGYQSLSEIARSIGCSMTYWQADLKADASWSFSLEKLETLVQADTKAVIVNFPHNPTGAMLSQAEWQHLCSICHSSGTYLFSDEMYRGLEHRDTAMLPTAADTYERGISLCGMSKALSMPGLRIGWLATQDTQLLNSVMQLKDYTTICNSAPSEVLALMGLRNRRTILKRNKQLLQDNLTLLGEFFHQFAGLFQWSEPDASSITFPQLASGEDAERFCQQCVEQAGVLLLPGSQLTSEADDSFRSSIRFGFGRQNMPECLNKLESHLHSYVR